MLSARGKLGITVEETLPMSWESCERLRFFKSCETQHTARRAHSTYSRPLTGYDGAHTG